MKPDSSRKRWWLWLPLLALALWLAIFGDKTPTGSLVPTPVNARSTTRPITNVPPIAATQAETVADLSSASKPLTSNTLDAIIPRPKLILTSKTTSNINASLFTSGSWSPPPPPPPVIPTKPLPPPSPVAPPAPTAPKLPFTFVGKKLEVGVWEVFLARGEQSFVVREGSVIENTYRIDKISPPNVSLTYLPLGQNQSLSIGASE